MKSFYQFYDQMNGEMYKDVSSPTSYELEDYGSQVTNNQIGGRVDDFKPISHEEMGSVAHDDAIAWLQKHGQNTTKLGEPMSDEEFNKHHGIT